MVEVVNINFAICAIALMNRFCHADMSNVSLVDCMPRYLMGEILVITIVTE